MHWQLSNKYIKKKLYWRQRMKVNKLIEYEPKQGEENR